MAVRKSRTICSWQVAHSSEPTNSAPGILGGARIVRLVVLQESKITASATAPPAPHNKLSRLPPIHRVSLERHTNSEYAQKTKMLTTHFFGKNEWLYFPPESSIQGRFVRFEWIARYALGDFPDSFLKTRGIARAIETRLLMRPRRCEDRHHTKVCTLFRSEYAQRTRQNLCR